MSPEDKFWDNYFDVTLGPYPRPFETLQETHDFQTEYGRPPGGGKTGPGKGVPKKTEVRKPRYLCEVEDVEGQSRGRHRWWLSTPWEYFLFIVYYESLKRALKTKTIYGYRCDERLKLAWRNLHASHALHCARNWNT